ncbi:MAG TPA: hypothetical protein GX497_03350 [Bacillus bacterium]|nr:hypothetical protein [Bacillus sp. (in: firmicutes)]
MSKVILTKEQAESLESEVAYRSKEMIVRLHTLGPNGWKGEACGLNGLPLEVLIKALTHGYEVS